MPSPSYISNVNVSPYGADEQEIKRKQRLAEMLQQQSLEPLQAPQGGAFASPISPLQVLAKGLQAYKGKEAETAAKTQQEALAQKQQTDRQGALTRALQASQAQPAQPMQMDAADNVQNQATPAMPADPSRGLSTLAQSGDPGLMQMASPIFNMQQQQLKQQQDQQFRASESAEARASREQMATESREGRQAQMEVARQDRLAAEGRSANLRRELQGNQQQFASQQAEENRKFREMMANAAKEGKPLTEFQGRNVLFGARMVDADKAMREIEETTSATAIASKNAVQNMPIIGGIAGAAANAMLPAKAQRLEQSQRNFVNAVLRQESGAVINKEEFDNARKQYFPQPGDDKTVLAQKRRNREIAINAFRVLAGPGASQIDTLQQTPRMPGNTANLGPSAEGKINNRRSTDLDALLDKYAPRP